MRNISVSRTKLPSLLRDDSRLRHQGTGSWLQSAPSGGGGGARDVCSRYTRRRSGRSPRFLHGK